MKLYSWLLRLYPARFREEYLTPMEQQFRDEYRDAQSMGSKAQLWFNAMWDLWTSLPAQLARELTLDLRHALRIYRKRVSSMAFAIVALGLAIGISTGVFSVLNALLLKSLPFSHENELTELWLSPVTAGNGRAAFAAWSRSRTYLKDAATFSSSEMNLSEGRGAFRLKVAETSANFFHLLGTPAALGRTFSADEDVTGRNGVAVIGYGLWQQVFGGDPQVIGKSLHLNGALLIVVGVAPAGFDYPGRTALWVPTAFDIETIPKRGAFLYQTIGRLKRGVSLQKAQEFFQSDVRRARKATRETAPAEEQNRPHLASLRNQLAGTVRQASWALSALTLLLLLAACANVAQLLLSRATERRAELELRAALGASRARLVQQLITEATFLTSISALLGLVVAYWTTRAAAAIVPAQLASQTYTLLDWRVVMFAASLALITGLLFGVLPSLAIGSLQPSTLTVRSKPGGQTIATKRLRGVLIALQAALTLALLVSSLVMGRTFLRLLQVDLGFRPANVVTLNLSLQGTRHQGLGQWQYYHQSLLRLRSLKGVLSAGAVSHLPLANNIYMANSIKLDSGQEIERIIMNAVAPQYFEAMGTRLVAGSDFIEDAAHGPARSVIVNEAFAKKAGLGTAIVGRQLTAPWSSNRPYRIAGVVSTARFAGPADPGQAQAYWQIEEEPPASLTLVARVGGKPETLLAQCRDALRALDPEVPVYDVKTLEKRLDENLARPRFYATLTVVLASLALLLAGVGIYGTTAYAIAQQKHEFGVRVAIGATHHRLRNELLTQTLGPLVLGSGIGIALSILTGTFLNALSNHVTHAQWSTYVLASAFLLLTGLVSSFAASRRVFSIDPAEALRSE